MKPPDSSPRRRFSDVFHSIRFKLTMWFLLILALILAGFSAFVYFQEVKAVYSRAESRLNLRMSELDLLVRRNTFREDNDWERIPATAITSDVPLQENEVLIISSAGGGIPSTWGPVTDDIGVQLAQLAPAWKTGEVYRINLDQGGREPERYLFSASPVAFEGRLLGWITAGQAIDPEGSLRRLLLTLIFTGAATLTAAALGGYWLASRVLDPVKDITRTAREIGGSDLSRRLDIAARDEIGELAGTFNQMLERLESAFNRQRQFTADASHELRSPLTIIGLEASRALSARRTQEEYQQTLKTIQSENEFMSRLVSELLTLARMDSGKVQLRLEPLDLSSLAVEVLERYAPIAAEKGIQLKAGDLPELEIQGDRQYLFQMAGNLVENAIKYTPGGVDSRVLVETQAYLLGDKPAALLRITDNGPGIPAEHLPHLFDRFYRVDQARSHNIEEARSAGGQEGVGLGLSIVQWIVQMHGGSITIDSEPGRGTRVEILLPAAGEMVREKPHEL